MVDNKVQTNSAVTDQHLLDLANFVLQKFLIRADVVEKEKTILAKAVNKLEEQAQIIKTKSDIKNLI
ncbi:hypothetical protein KKA13_01730 [Patescibacteria group bacterium]|nr:hypothetical protein [Patescibacteria group bacterium]